MFKDLFAFLDQWKAEGDEQTIPASVKEVLDNINKFAFHRLLNEILKKSGINLDATCRPNEYLTVISALLSRGGLNYAELPKGLLHFHEYSNGSRTSFEEHLVEGAQYCKTKNGKVSVHFTVTPEHQPLFENLLIKVRHHYESAYQVTFDVTFSAQSSSTDTLAVDLQNNPFRNQDGSLLFRPGGHGALIHNLDHLRQEIIFIKNIDNVVPDYLKAKTIRYKKILAGLVLSLREKVYHFLNALDSGKPDHKLIDVIIAFYCKDFFL